MLRKEEFQNFSTKNTEKSIFEQLGGYPAIDAVVDAFYVKVLSNDLVKGFFEDINMDKQRKKQKDFITFATGGPNNYTGRGMRAVHKKLHLEDKHFDEICKLLVETLRDFKVPEELIKNVGNKLEPLRNDVLNK